jgi:hypothetical protein
MPVRSVLVASCALLAALLLAACGGSSPTTGASNPADRALAFARCMREHGVKGFPNPEVSGRAVRFQFSARGKAGGATPQTMEAAQKACRRFAPGEGRKLSPQEKVQREEQVRKFARCMREHGVKLQAGTSSNGGGFQIRIGGPRGGGPNPESPAFQAAQKACSGLLPFRKGPGGPKVGGTRGGPGSGPGFSIGG